MSKNKLLLKSNLKIPVGIQDLLEDPPLLITEDPKLYFDLFSAIAADVKPEGVIEWLWLKDIVYYTWEIWRAQAFKNHIIENERGSRARRIAGRQLDKEWKQLDRTAQDRLAGPSYAEEKIRELMPKLDSEADSATAFAGSIDTLERMDKLLVSTEQRRDNTLREIELRREIYARRLRDASEKIIDAKSPKALVAAE